MIENISRSSGAKIGIVFGVSGAGKSTLAAALAKSLGVAYLDADDFHPESNRLKMASGQALSDADREPWLDILAKKLEQHLKSGEGVILACSALKESYRKRLDPSLSYRWIQLLISAEEAVRRVSARSQHFMPATLVASQFAAWELSGTSLNIEAEWSTEAQLEAILKAW